VVKILIATFANDDGANRALGTVAAALERGRIEQAAIVFKGDDGKIRFSESDDTTTAEGALKGAGAGAVVGVVGLLFGPLALLAAPIGAGVGALIGKLRDTGFDDDELRALGADLAPGGSALVATIDEDALGKAQRLLTEVDVQRVIVREVDSELADALDAELASPSAPPEAPPLEAPPPA
jgi:uncharacterized membrane protein